MLASKKIFRWIIYAVILMLGLVVIAAAIIRFVIFPNIDQYKDEISAKISHKIGLKTTIGNIVTDWDGISPRILIRAIDIYDEDNTTALHLENVKGTFSWLSIPLMHTHLSNISVRNPKLTIRRHANGSIYIAGIPLTGEGKPDMVNWLLSQANIDIKNAAIIWQDDLRQAPALSLNQVNLKLENPAWRKIFGQHVFNLSALPSTGTKQPIIINGHFFGRDVSKIKTWHGYLNMNMNAIDLTAWKAWVDYPIDLQTGAGDAKIAMSFTKKKIGKIKADIAFQHLSGKVNEKNKPFDIDQLSGVITWKKNKQSTTISAQNVKLSTQNNINIDNASGLVTHLIKNKKPWINASLKLDAFNLTFFNQLNTVLTLPESFSKPLHTLAPRGQLKDLTISWQGEPHSPTRYQIKTAFSALSINAYNNIPGVKNLSGKINANENNGLLALVSKNALLDFKGILRWPIPAQKLNGIVTWRKSNDHLKIKAKNIFLANPHISGTINTSYDMNGVKGGYLNLSAAFDNGNAKYAPFYYPTVLNKDAMEWLDSSIISGKANDIKLTVKGHLQDFPFVDKKNKLDPKLGIFKVTARINDAVLEYGKNWPAIKGLGLNMLFEGNRMELNADKGNILGVKIIKSKVTIPVLNTKTVGAQVLHVDSIGKGPVAEGIKFINASPVKTVTQGFTDDLKTSGNGTLNLGLVIPLSHVDDTEFNGKYKIDNGAIYKNARLGLPEISRIFGTLTFTENTLKAQNIHAQILDGPVQFSLKTNPNNSIHIDASGTAKNTGIKTAMPSVFSESLSGSAAWTADIVIKKPLLDINIESDLLGLAVNLPAPLHKLADQEATLKISKTQTQEDRDLFEISYNEVVSAKILRIEKEGELAIERGDIAINMPAEVPAEPGLNLHGKFDYINVDEWLALTDKQDASNTSNLTLNKADLSIEKLDLFNRSLHKLNVVAKPNNGYLQMHIASQELDGDVQWLGAKNAKGTGKIIARLKKLHIPTSNQEEDNTADKDIRKLDRKYPSLDIKVDDFKLGTKMLGMLELNAYESNENWVIKSLKINNPDSSLIADGTWHNWARNPNTNLKFTLSANDVGKTLKRFGQADAIKGGVAIISGRLQWPGSPHEFQKNGLNGEFTLGASKGQVVKVKPGVGRLLGLLTLQSLPRRLTLDFRDLFSEGFAFDEISATANINNGIMKSDDFFMTGPAAETEIKGETNLTTETQNFKVKVVPHISDSFSLAALAGGPIAGAAAFIAQKLLKDPLNKIAQSEYVITGTWDNPVEAASEKEKKEPKPSPLNAQEN